MTHITEQEKILYLSQKCIWFHRENTVQSKLSFSLSVLLPNSPQKTFKFNYLVYSSASE